MDQADDVFIERWKPFVSSIATKLQAEYDLRGIRDELLSAGFTGLLEARARFDPSRGVQLNTFAYYRVRGAMIDHIRALGFTHHRAHARRRAAEAANELLGDLSETRGAAPPGTPDLAQTLQTLDSTLARMTASFVLASLGQAGEPRPTAEDELVAEEQAGLVRQAIETLPERERALVHGFYFEGRRFDEVAEELGISKSWASRLHAKALDLLRAALEGSPRSA